MLTRYRLHSAGTYDGVYHSDAHIAEHPSGEYVLYQEAQQAIATLTERLATARHDAVRAFIHGEDKLCLVCGAKEPCGLKDDPSNPCTFDQTPMELYDQCRRLTERVRWLENRLLKHAQDAELARVKGA